VIRNSIAFGVSIVTQVKSAIMYFKMLHPVCTWLMLKVIPMPPH